MALLATLSRQDLGTYKEDGETVGLEALCSTLMTVAPTTSTCRGHLF
jgi:hypothetical protein